MPGFLFVIITLKYLKLEMALFNENDLLIYAPDLSLTSSQLVASVLRMEGVIAGKLKKPTLRPSQYKQEIFLDESDFTIYPNYKPLISVTSLEASYDSVINFGRRTNSSYELLNPSEYEVDTAYHEIRIIAERMFIGKRRFRIRYTSGFDANSPPEILEALKIAIAQGLEYMHSPAYEGIRTETLSNEISVTYDDSSSGSSVMERHINDIIAPLLIWRS